MRKAASLLLSLSILLSFALFLTSCEGDQGPAGPAGEDAEFTSITVTFTGAEAGITGSFSEYNIDVPEITQDIVDHGVVLVYLNDSLNPEPEGRWILIPFAMIVEDITISFIYSYGVGTLSMVFNSSDAEWPFSADSYYHLKIVILAGATQGGVNLGNFEEINPCYLNDRPI